MVGRGPAVLSITSFALTPELVSGIWGAFPDFPLPPTPSALPHLHLFVQVYNPGPLDGVDWLIKSILILYFQVQIGHCAAARFRVNQSMQGSHPKYTYGM